jgi:hypothetical protein
MSRLLPKRRPDILADGLPDGSAVLYDPCSERVYAISSTAAWVWSACDGAHAVDEVVGRLLESFETDASTVDHDIGLFLQDLDQRGLVEAEGGASDRA